MSNLIWLMIILLVIACAAICACRASNPMNIVGGATGGDSLFDRTSLPDDRLF